MFIIAKLALVTCAFYVGLSLLLEAALLGLALWRGGIFYSINFKAWALIFGPMWLVSFAVAWRIMMVPFLARFPRPH